MKTLKTEAALWAVLREKLKNEGVTGYRLESHATMNGLPDVMFHYKANTYWLEMKAMPKLSINSEEFTVDWRPGQQAFASRLRHCFIKHNYGGLILAPCSWTIIACKDGIILLLMGKFFIGNKVHADESYFVYKFTFDEFNELNLSLFIFTHSFLVGGTDCFRLTYRLFLEYYNIKAVNDEDIESICTLRELKDFIYNRLIE